MNNNTAYSYRRRRRFVDKMIQGQLLWGLIIIECLLFSSGMIIIYNDLQMTLQDSMYRVHQEINGGRPLLLKELMLIFPWIITANLLLVVIVDRRWKKVVRKIVFQLQDILYRVKRLDLRIYSIQQTDHEVLQHAKQWLDKERDRNARLQAQMREISELTKAGDTAELHQVRERLKNMGKLLPDN